MACKGRGNSAGALIGKKSCIWKYPLRRSMTDDLEFTRLGAQIRAKKTRRAAKRGQLWGDNPPSHHDVDMVTRVISEELCFWGTSSSDKKEGKDHPHRCQGRKRTNGGGVASIQETSFARTRFLYCVFWDKVHGRQRSAPGHEKSEKLGGRKTPKKSGSRSGLANSCSRRS